MANGKYTEVKPDIETFAKILVVGVGGSGGSAVSRMIESGLRGVEFVAINTDAQALHHNPAKHKVHIGQSTTRGLGAGMDPAVGAKAAEESQEELGELVKGADMVFVTCGLGGGMRSSANQVVAPDIVIQPLLCSLSSLPKHHFAHRRRQKEASLSPLRTGKHIPLIMNGAAHRQHAAPPGQSMSYLRPERLPPLRAS